MRKKAIMTDAKLWKILNLSLIIMAIFYRVIPYQSMLPTWDELGTIVEIHYSYPKLWSYLLEGKHPPIYFFSIKFLSTFFTINYYLIKIPSSLACLVLIYIFYNFALKELGNYISYVVTFLFGLSYPVFLFGFEGRPYIFIMLFSFLGFIFYNDLLKKTIRENIPSNWIICLKLYVIGMVCLYTSYLSGLLFCCFTFIFLLIMLKHWGLKIIKSQIKIFFTIFAITISYLPWFLLTKKKIAQHFWEHPQGSTNYLYYLKSFFNHSDVMLFVFIISVLISIFCLFYPKKMPWRKDFSFLFAGYSLFLFLIILRSIFFSSLISFRYTALLTPFFYIIIGLGLKYIFNTKKGSLLSLLFFIPLMYLNPFYPSEGGYYQSHFIDFNKVFNRIEQLSIENKIPSQLEKTDTFLFFSNPDFMYYPVMQNKFARQLQYHPMNMPPRLHYGGLCQEIGEYSQMAKHINYINQKRYEGILIIRGYNECSYAAYLHSELEKFAILKFTESNISFNISIEYWQLISNSSKD